MDYAEEKLKPHTHSNLPLDVFERKQTYLNLLYLLLSFPLGLLYFIFLAVGLLGGISSTFILGIPVLIGVVYAWQYIAQFERYIAISWLHVKIRPLLLPFPPGSTFWERFRLRLRDLLI
jgi:two-component system, OmpR family, phosphate regulon sensor histidine kinase PhoR